MEKDDALRRSRVQADLAKEAAEERRLRLERELKEENQAREAALRRSRLDLELEEQEAEKIAAEKRARLEAEIAANKAARE